MALAADAIGAKAQATQAVAAEHFASRVYPGTPDVYSTPALGALVEATAAGWMAAQIEPEQMSVGTQIVINHTAATPPGLSVTVEVEVTAVEGRRVDFRWTAHDEREEVGTGTHQRFVVDRERFVARLATKTGG